MLAYFLSKLFLKIDIAHRIKQESNDRNPQSGQVGFDFNNHYLVQVSSAPPRPPGGGPELPSLQLKFTSSDFLCRIKIYIY